MPKTPRIMSEGSVLASTQSLSILWKEYINTRMVSRSPEPENSSRRMVAQTRLRQVLLYTTIDHSLEIAHIMKWLYDNISLKDRLRIQDNIIFPFWYFTPGLNLEALQLLLPHDAAMQWEVLRGIMAHRIMWPTGYARRGIEAARRGFRNMLNQFTLEEWCRALPILKCPNDYLSNGWYPSIRTVMAMCHPKPHNSEAEEKYRYLARLPRRKIYEIVSDRVSTYHLAP